MAISAAVRPPKEPRRALAEDADSRPHDQPDAALSMLDYRPPLRLRRTRDTVQIPTPMIGNTINDILTMAMIPMKRNVTSNSHIEGSGSIPCLHPTPTTTRTEK